MTCERTQSAPSTRARKPVARKQLALPVACGAGGHAEEEEEEEVPEEEAEEESAEEEDSWQQQLVTCGIQLVPAHTAIHLIEP